LLFKGDKILVIEVDRDLTDDRNAFDCSPIYCSDEIDEEILAWFKCDYHSIAKFVDIFLGFEDRIRDLRESVIPATKKRSF
jgi:hypothetical protein